jgi:hypothetical protein
MSVPLAPNAPETYVVKKGDTLWDISGVFLKYPWYWPEIWYVNPQVENPHLIYPGDVLRLVYVDGKPRVTLDKAGDVRLSPQVRSEPLAQAIRTVPYDVLMKFTRRPSLLTRDTVRNAPYIVGFRNRHIVGSTANEAYARGLGTRPPGSIFTVVHVGEELRDPDDGDLLGYAGIFAGTVEVIETTGSDRWGSEEITHLSVLETGREILQGDKLVPEQVPDQRACQSQPQRPDPRRRRRRPERGRPVLDRGDQPRQARRPRAGQRARDLLPGAGGP